MTRLRRYCGVVAALVAALAPFAGAPAMAATLRLAWNPNPETDIARYEVAWGTASGAPTQTLNAGAATSAAIDGLREGVVYFFVVRAVNTSGLASDPSGEVSATAPFPAPGMAISRTDWSILRVDSEETAGYPAAYAIDGKASTFWHSEWINRKTPLPHEIAIDLGFSRPVGAFRYLPRQDGFVVGDIRGFEFLVSPDGANWSVVASGTLAAGKAEKEASFPARTVRFVALRALSSAADSSDANAAEIQLLAAAAGAPDPASAPVAASSSHSGSEDADLAIRLTGSDPQGRALSFRLLSTPRSGTLGGSAPDLVYRPAPDFNGGDSFTFSVSADGAESAAATASLTITPVNDAPIAAGKVVTTPRGRAVGFRLFAADKERDPLLFEIVTAPLSGVLTGTAPDLTYAPDPSFAGADAFSYRVFDGQAWSNAATVRITVTPP